jgi:hypothetical protein
MLQLAKVRCKTDFPHSSSQLRGEVISTALLLPGCKPPVHSAADSNSPLLLFAENSGVEVATDFCDTTAVLSVLLSHAMGR